MLLPTHDLQLNIMLTDIIQVSSLSKQGQTWDESLCSLLAPVVADDVAVVFV